MKSSDKLPENERASVIRDAVGRAVAWLGRKQGAYAASQAIGVPERVILGIHYGEAFAASIDRAERAREFRRDLARQRIQSLRAELAEAERLAGEHEAHSQMGRGGFAAAG